MTILPPDHAPRRPENRPGLDDIAYRITTQPEALARMLFGLPREIVTDPETGALRRPLAALRTRQADDPTVALADAWAAALDVLSFYSERVANEGYIGTARERRSVLELARMIGYELAPGRAAATHLAFTVETADDPYREVTIEAGLQAMSVPRVKGELSQVFETEETILARAEWNAIPARTQRPQRLALYRNAANPADPRNDTLYLFDLDGSFDDDALADPDLVTVGAASGLAPFHAVVAGLDLHAALARRIADAEASPEIDPVLHALPVDEVYLAGTGLNLRPGTRILAVAGETTRHALPLRVVSAEEQPDFGVTRTVLTRSGQPPTKVRRAPRLLVSRLRIGQMPRQTVALDRRAIETHVTGTRWTGDGLDVFVRRQGWARAKTMTLVRRMLAPPPDSSQIGFHVMDTATGAFGAAAVEWRTLNYGTKTDGTPDKGPYPQSWETRTVWTDSQGTALSGPADMYLDREVKEVVPDGWIILEAASGASMGLRVTQAASESRADYGLTGKATGVGLARADGTAVTAPGPDETSVLNNFRTRSTTVHAASRRIAAGGIPLTGDLTEGADAIDLDALYLDLERGRPVSLQGARTDAEGLDGRETHIIRDVVHIDGITRLLLSDPTAHPYARSSVRLNANVARASHGERVEEVLGSGDARLPFQRFALRKPPLTYVAAANPTGRRSTLEVRVDGVRWHEVAALGAAGPEDAVYEVRHEDDGTARLRFGDGVTGRRLPTGEDNVVAVYRSGLGPEGEVAEEAIIQMRTRPVDVRSVVNPSPATGSAAPETLAMARVNAPASVRTLGRIVSLTDYRDFALAFSGVGKADAREIWSGTTRLVHVTVAPENDAPLGPADPLLSALRAAMEGARDPARPLTVAPYARRFFQIRARLSHDPDYLAEDVLAAAQAALDAGFGYDARALGQGVSAAQIVAALQAVPGVVHTDLDSLAPIEDGSQPDAAATLATWLPASVARGPGRDGSRTPRAAELLTLLPSAAVLTAEEIKDA
jgi:predicted phage baseplate assembly protein